MHGDKTWPVNFREPIARLALRNWMFGFMRGRSGKSKVPEGWLKVHLSLKEQERATFSSPENRCLSASTLKPEERELDVDSRALMHVISKKDLNSAEMDTLTKSCCPAIVITAKGEVGTHDYVSKNWMYSWLWNSSKNTSEVVSFGKLFDENGCSYEWFNGQKKIKTVIQKQCNTENFVPIVAPG